MLVSPTGQAFLCDFGLATHSNIDQRWQTLTKKTHPSWLAYEFFEVELEGRKPQKLTVKTDVFAFGCICYEVILLQRPKSKHLAHFALDR